MRACAYKGCTSAASQTVRTPRGTLDVCIPHEAVLREAGEIAVPAPVIPVIVVDSAEHRPNIRAGIEAARERGTHVGRPPVPVPDAAIAAVRAGEPVKAVARAHGIEPNTLRRRASGEVAAPTSTPDPWTEGHRLMGEAIRLRDKARAAIAAAEAQLDEVRAMVDRARELLDADGGPRG